jgi:hypothetical protein
MIAAAIVVPIGSSHVHAQAQASAGSATWSQTGSLAEGRKNATATLLQSGKVLVAGGYDTEGRPLASAELYDPQNGTWQVTAGMHIARANHTAVLLRNGTVLVVGGNEYPNTNQTTAEIYDPATGTWPVEYPTPLNISTQGATLTLLQNGRALYAGGTIGTAGAWYIPYVYDPNPADPSHASWTQAGYLTYAHGSHPTATLLTNGEVLLAGGTGGNSSNGGDFQTIDQAAELFDPTSGTWSKAADMHVPRYGHTAALLPNGDVLVAGGIGIDGLSTLSPEATATAELYDPTANTWTLTPPMASQRAFAAAVTLTDGHVLIAGGGSSYYSFSPQASAELYDSTSGTWSSIASMNVPRSSCTLTLLSDGRVLAVGGIDRQVQVGDTLYPEATASAELYGTASASNTAPTVNTLPNATINEGSAYTTSGSFTDPDTGDAWTASVDYGDGSGKQPLTLNADKTFSLSHVYDDNGSYTATVTVTDKAGASGSGTATVMVNNVPPTITNLSGPTQVLTGTKLSYSGIATDPSNADTKAGFTWNWSVDGTAAATGNPASLTFASCGSHTVSATATDKDGGISAPASLTSTVSAYDGAWQPPLYFGQYNVAKAGSVIPVKITVGCNGAPLTGLSPTIQLIQGDVDGTTDTGTNYVATTSVSSADTTGIMRYAAPQYIYNQQVPSAASGTLFTIRVRPFGNNDAADGMYILIKIK